MGISKVIIRGVCAVGALVAALLVAPTAASAASVDLYVARSGSDAGSCSQAAPCATINGALASTSAAGVRVHLAPSDIYDEISITVPFGRSVSILGTGTDWQHGGGTVVETRANTGVTNHGSLTLSDTEFDGGTHGIVNDGALALHNVFMQSGPAIGIQTSSGSVSLSDVYLRLTSTTDIGMIIDGGAVTASRLHIDAPIHQTAGSFQADTLLAADGSPRPFAISGGTAVISRSLFYLAGDSVTVTGTGSATVSQSTFADDDSGVVVNGTGAHARLLDDTFGPSSWLPGAVQVQNGTAEMAGTAIVGGGNGCVGPVTDGGYNILQADGCTLTEPTSKVIDRGAVLHPLAYDGIGTADLAPLADSPMVDVIPPGSVAAFDHSVSLCGPVTDQRGQLRPVGNCDVGAVELARSTITTTPTTATVRYGQFVTFRSHVSTPNTALEPIQGTVQTTSPQWTFPGPCQGHGLDPNRDVACTTGLMWPGVYTVIATYQPTDAYHGKSARMTLTVLRDISHITWAVTPKRPLAGHSVVVTGHVMGPFGSGTGIVAVVYLGHEVAGCQKLALNKGFVHCTIPHVAAGAHAVRLAYLGSQFNETSAVTGTLVGN